MTRRHALRPVVPLPGKETVMSEQSPARLSRHEIEAQGGAPLPAKEVVSLLDLNLDLDLALDLAAPIDLAVAANANVAAPIVAGVSANVLSFGSTAGALADQDVLIDQHISGDAIATAPQTSEIDQSDDTVGGDELPVPEPVPVPVPDGDLTSLLQGGLLNVDVDVALDADLAAPVAGAVAANANVAAPIDAAVAANIASVGSEATAIATQNASIVQDLDGVVAEATAEQDSTITQ
jgi:hypothetical protein